MIWRIRTFADGKLSQRLLFAFLLAASGLGLDLPAGAQLAGGRWRSMRIRALSLYSLAISGATADHPTGTISLIRFGAIADRLVQYNSYDPYNPFNRRPQPQAYKSIKPPAARKVETPPAETVLVIGDSLGEWLAYGLELVFAETPQIGIVRKIKPDLGLVRDDARLDAPEWTQAIKDLLPATEKPKAIVVMLGVNDRAPLRERAPAAKESTHPTANIPHPARSDRSILRRAQAMSFTPTNGPSFMPSASTT